MTAVSPKGLFAFERSGNEPAEQSIEQWIAVVENWAKAVLKEAGIKWTPGNHHRLVGTRGQVADEINFALRAMAGADSLRHALDIAAKTNDAARVHSVWCAFRMMDLCNAAYAGKIVHLEPPLDTGTRQRETLGGIRENANAKRHAQSEKKAARWNTLAAPVWKKQPGLSASAVAVIIKKHHELREAPKTIARKLKKVGRAG